MSPHASPPSPALRRRWLLFARAAWVSRQEKLCRALLAGGRTPAELVRMRVGDLPPTSEAKNYLKRRAGARFDVLTGGGELRDTEGRTGARGAEGLHLRGGPAV